jgi:hypothetical protein
VKVLDESPFSESVVNAVSPLISRGHNNYSTLKKSAIVSTVPEADTVPGGTY